MSAITKLIAMLTCLIIALGCFASCEVPEEPEDLQTDKYVATVTTRFTSEDSKMKDALDAAGDSVLTLTVNGNDVRVASAVEINNISMEVDYIYTAGMLYHSQSIKVGDKQVTTLKKAAMSDADKEALLESVGAAANIEIDDFDIHQKIESGDKLSYTCTGISDEAKSGLCSIVKDKLSYMSATVALTDATYKEVQYKGRIQSSTLSCDFIVTVDGVEYAITMETEYQYDFDASARVVMPSDTSMYTKVELSDIIK